MEEAGDRPSFEQLGDSLRKMLESSTEEYGYLDVQPQRISSHSKQADVEVEGNRNEGSVTEDEELQLKFSPIVARKQSDLFLQPTDAELQKSPDLGEASLNAETYEWRLWKWSFCAEHYVNQIGPKFNGNPMGFR